MNNEKISSLKKLLDSFGVIFLEIKTSSGLYIKFAKNFGNIAHYPMLKRADEEYPEITVVDRKRQIKDQASENNFILTLAILKNHQDTQC